MINNVPNNHRDKRKISYPAHSFMDHPAEMSYNRTGTGSPAVKVEEDMDRPLGLSKEPAEPILRKYLKHIKKTIKEKISLYEPLDFKTAFNGFLQRLHREETGTLRQWQA